MLYIIIIACFLSILSVGPWQKAYDQSQHEKIRIHVWSLYTSNSEYLTPTPRTHIQQNPSIKLQIDVTKYFSTNHKRELQMHVIRTSGHIMYLDIFFFFFFLDVSEYLINYLLNYH